MKQFVWLFLALTLCTYSQTSGNGVIDLDGNQYNSVIIGTQEWMAENLKTTKYCNGDELPMNNNNSTGTWGNLTVGAWNFVNSNSSTYPNEKFYNWYAASDSRNVCPCNWHVPSDNEWTILENYLIANTFNYDGTTSGNKIAKAMASQNLFWNSSLNIGAVGNNLSLNNSSGFNALPFGLITESGINYGYNAGNYAFWWTSNEWDTDNTYAIWRGLSSQNNNLWSGAPDIGMKTAGFSVRCLKNTSLGIENQSKSLYKIYPNPSKGVFTLQMFQFFDEKTIEIYNAFGQKIYDAVISSNYTTIDISSQPTGIYFYKIYDGNNSNSGKLILE